MRQLIALLLYFLLFATICESARSFRRLRDPAGHVKLGKDPVKDDYSTRWFTQTIDHFNWFSQPQTFQQRYLYNDKYWAGVNKDGTCNGPIFFYTGNEGDITMFYDNTGFVTDVLAPKFSALIIFAEHRYYGQTLPFGDQSFTPKNLSFLSSEQALADYAVLIGALKSELNAEQCPVIAFGGSYGGMLTAWFRIKYPWVVDGGLAASAPILQFYGTGVSQFVFSQINTQDFTDASPQCSSGIRQGFNEIQQQGQTQSGLDYLTKTFSLCDPLQTQEDVATLIGWLEGALQFLGMVDYPYPANFLEPLPGWPIEAVCEKFDQPGDLLPNFANAMGVYFNYTGQAGSCYNLNSTATPSLGTTGWDYQSCTEMVFPLSSNGVTDMYPPALFNLTAEAEYCQYTYGVTPRPFWGPTYYGAQNLEAASNIVFSNGQLDPWRGGGVQTSISDTVVAIIIEDGAHHLDLRSPDPRDPPSVTAARATETQYIEKWLKEAFEKRRK